MPCIPSVNAELLAFTQILGDLCDRPFRDTGNAGVTHQRPHGPDRGIKDHHPRSVGVQHVAAGLREILPCFSRQSIILIKNNYKVGHLLTSFLQL